MTKLLQYFLGQVKGNFVRRHQRLNFAFFNIFLIIGTYSGTRKATATQKAHSIAVLAPFRWVVFRFGLRWTVRLPESKISKNSSFCEKRYSLITFVSVETRHSFCEHRVPLARTRRKRIIIWPQKVMLRIWPKGKIMTWSEKAMLHISWSVSSAWTHGNGHGPKGRKTFIFP